MAQVLVQKKEWLIIIARKPYGIKISGAAWIENLAETLDSLAYKSFVSEARVCMKQDFSPNGDPC